MATYFVASSGSNTSPYDTWAKAATSLQTALTAASGGSDTVVLQYNAVPSGDAEVSTNTVYTFPAGVALLAATNDGGSAYTVTEMGADNWIGNSTTNRNITLAGSAAFIRGLTVRTAGTSTAVIQIGASSSLGCDMTLSRCYLWIGTINAGSHLNITYGASTGQEAAFFFRDCTFRFANTSQSINFMGRCEMVGGSISASGSVPTLLFIATTGSAGSMYCYGVDLSLVTGTLVGNQQAGFKQHIFSQCRFGSGVVVMAAQTSNPNASACEVFVHDCNSGNVHYSYEYHNALGSVVADPAIYANDGAAYDTAGNKASWKIVTTANATFLNPFITPWISVHHEGTSAITPNFECVRSGNSTAYTNAEVWSAWMYKGTSSTTLGTIDNTDRSTVHGTPANQTTGALGASDWTGESGTSWFGKLSPTSSITPVAIGDLCGRVIVGLASTTVYVDPQIRGRT